MQGKVIVTSSVPYCSNHICLQTSIFYSSYDNASFIIPSAFERDKHPYQKPAHHQNLFSSQLKPKRLILLSLFSVRNRLLYSSPSISMPLLSIPPLQQVPKTRTWNCCFIRHTICRVQSSTCRCFQRALIHPHVYVLQAE